MRLRKSSEEYRPLPSAPQGSPSGRDWLRTKVEGRTPQNRKALLSSVTIGYKITPKNEMGDFDTYRQDRIVV
jgi:hypothetical protein